MLDWADIINTLIGTVTGATLALASSLILYNRQNNDSVEGSATILHHDINHSMTGLEIAFEKRETTGEVLMMPHSNLIGNSDFRKLIIDLRKRVSGKNINHLLNFFGNLETLEKQRKAYWTTEIPSERLIEIRSYYDMLDLVKSTIDDDLRKAFKKVEKLSKLKGIRG